ncbi:hypothetical protein FF38_04192, partial [Lucilia cuprina]
RKLVILINNYLSNEYNKILKIKESDLRGVLVVNCLLHIVKICSVSSKSIFWIFKIFTKHLHKHLEN